MPCEIELQDVHVGFAKDSKHTRCRVLSHEIRNLVALHAAGASHPHHLKRRVHHRFDYGLGMSKSDVSQKNHRFPPQIIARVVRLYFRFRMTLWSRKCCWSAGLPSLTKRSHDEAGD
jgi:hypothetical protein